MRALPELAAREDRAKPSERYGTALTEGLFMAGRDGVTFKRWNEAFLRPGPERDGTWHYGHQYLAWSVVQTRGSLPGGPDELSFYATESYWTGKSSLLRRYSLRLDGFVSVKARFPAVNSSRNRSSFPEKNSPSISPVPPPATSASRSRTRPGRRFRDSPSQSVRPCSEIRSSAS